MLFIINIKNILKRETPLQVYADRSGQRHMRQDHHHCRSRHHAGPAQSVHHDDCRRFSLLSAGRPATHLFLCVEKISVAVLRVAGTRARHRFCHGFQVRTAHHRYIIITEILY